jgi:chromosome segregation ATPase
MLYKLTFMGVFCMDDLFKKNEDSSMNEVDGFESNSSHLLPDVSDQDKKSDLISVRSGPETIRIWNEVKEFYPTSKEALDAVMRKGADVIARERAGSDVGDFSKEVISVRNLTRRVCQIFEEYDRSRSSELRQTRDDHRGETNVLNQKINELKERFDLANKIRKEAVEASKSASAVSDSLEKRNKELELSVTNSQYTIDTLRKTNSGLLERINSVAKLERELSESIRLQHEISDSNRQIMAQNDLLSIRNKELLEENKELREYHNDTVKDLRVKHTEEIKSLKSEVELIKASHRAELDKMRVNAAEEIRQLRESLKDEHRQQIQELRQDAKDRLQDALQQKEVTCEARIRAAVAEALADR